MSRKNEIDCLNIVKKSLCGIGNTEITFYNYDLSLLKMMIDSARENDNNVFPDFVFDNGLIEHFMVSTSKENRKGSDYKISENMFEKERNKFIHNENETFLNSERQPETISTSSIEHTFEDASYEWFFKSFKKNFDNHLKSLMNNTQKKGTTIFLIEQKGAPLTIYEKDKFDRFYSINEDKNILIYLKDKVPFVDYIIFNHVDMVEIIDLSKIDKLLTTSKDKMDIRKGRYTYIQNLVKLDL